MTKLTYLDRTDLAETFVDTVAVPMADRSTVRVELLVERLRIPYSSPTATPEPVRELSPVARLVLTHDAAMDLHKRLTELLRKMSQTGGLDVQPVPYPTSTKQ